MGFFDALKSAGEYMNEQMPRKYEAMFKQATDDGLLKWYNEKRFDSDVDQRAVEICEKEMRRRGLYY